MEIVVAGSHGLLGSALVERLVAQGHDVRRLVRPGALSSDPRDVSWDPLTGRLDPGVLASADAVVNLGGAGVGDRRWTDSYRRRIRVSRVAGTLLLSQALATLRRADGRDRTLLQASASGWYGDRGDEPLAEPARPGGGFLAEVVRDWEAATAPASDAGVRVVRLRTAIVLSPRGGALGRLLPLIRLGAGGPLGSGRQYWSWITLRDHAAACTHLLAAPEAADVCGPVNLASPDPVPQAELVRALAGAVHRPAALRVPEAALRLAVDGFASELVASRRLVPAALHDAGFAWSDPTLADAVAWVTRDR